MNIFNNINDKDLEKLLKCLDAKNISFKKNSTIINNASNTNILSIITKGSASIIRIDYNGNKTLIENLKENDLFEAKMFNIVNNELSLIALEDTEITMISYDKISNRCEKNCPYHNILINNMLQIIIDKLNLSYERIQILTKKTIREKLLEYFKFEANKKHSKKFKMSLSFTSLAEYLAVDRSALMREVKYLKEDELLEINNKIVKINF